MSAGCGSSVGLGTCEQLSNCRRLEVLDVSDSNPSIDSRCLELLFRRGHPELCSLSLARCNQVDSDGLRFLCGRRYPDGYRLAASAKYPKLTMLDVGGCGTGIKDDISTL